MSVVFVQDDKCKHNFSKPAAWQIAVVILLAFNGASATYITERISLQMYLVHNSYKLGKSYATKYG